MVGISLVRQLTRQFSSARIKEMKYLNVAEKNDAAKTIAGFLSNGSARRREGFSVYNKIYEFETNVRGQNAKMVMTSVSGHLMNYEFVASYRGWNNCDPQQLFDAPVRKSCIQDNEPIKKTLEREIKSCQGLIIWTDCDREGENIGFEIIDVCKAIKPNIPVFRARFSEITAVAARRALANLIQPDKRQSDAVDVRQELDLRTGAAFTRFQTLRLQRIFPQQIAEKLISYGSCQIPTLGFVAARYKEAEEFVSEAFWKIKVTHTIDDLTVEFLWARNRLFDKEACEDYLLLCLTEPLATVNSVVTKPKNKWRPVALDTVELEKLGSRKLKINAKTVLSIAEKLYQQGIISYPRTETNQFSKEINLRALVENHAEHPEWGPFASRVLDWGPNPRNGNKSDEAHPPIHPIKSTTGLSGDEKRVYELIVRHFLACVSKDATGSETIVNITIAGEKFHANGLCIFERNYLDVYPYEKWNAKQIHRYETGQTFEPTEITMQEGATTAPPLLTEADLIALMDKHGIGTDATHAEHINTIKERGYIGEVERGFLVPGTIGMGLYEGYHAIELPLAEPVLRAEFEVDLKKICTGERNPRDVLNEQIRKYKDAYRILGEKVIQLDEQLARRLNEIPQQAAPEQSAPAVRTEEVLPCPKCSDSSLLLKQKRDATSFYLSCARFPDCKNTVWFSDDIKSVKVTENSCNKCGSKHRILEFKFKQMNYLALLNASGLTYSTCIACDSNFRNVFQINIELVKRVGAIVSDQSNQHATGRNDGRAGNGSDNRDIRSGGSALNQNSRTLQRNVPNARSNSTSTATDNQDRPNGISRYRGWGGLDTNLAQEINSTRQVANNQNSTNIADAFNDNFDDIFLNDDWDFGTSTAAPSNTSENSRPSNNRTTYNNTTAPLNTIENNRASNYNSVRNRNSTNHNSSAENRSRWESISAAPSNTTENNRANNYNSDRNINSNNNSSAENRSGWESISWGSSGGRVDIDRSSSWPNNNTSWGEAQENRRSTNDQPIVRCSVCNKVAKSLIVKKDGPNKGRSFYTCGSSCEFFQWANEASNSNQQVQNANRNTNRWAHIQSDSPNDASGVLCTCNRAAIERTVRKDGPNKGRQFYVCSKENNTDCQFFKWADENAQPNPGSSWGTGTSSSGSTSLRPAGNNSSRADQPSTSWGTNSSRPKPSSDDQPAKKRKCGLCRQEGHTKLKCPRKDELENY